MVYDRYGCALSEIFSVSKSRRTLNVREDLREKVELACSLPHLTWDDACAFFLNCRALCCTRLHCNLFFTVSH